MAIGIVKGLSEVVEWSQGYFVVFQRWLDGYMISQSIRCTG